MQTMKCDDVCAGMTMVSKVSRNRLIESRPGLDNVGRILATHSLASVLYIKPRHLTFHTQMPCGDIGCWVVEARSIYQDPICPGRCYRWLQRLIGQTRPAVGAESTFHEWR